MNNKRQIYINGRFLLLRPTGIQRFAYEICRSLIDNGEDVVIICPSTGSIDSSYDLSRMKIVRFGIGSSHFWEQIILPLYFLFRSNYLLLCLSGIGPVFVSKKVMTIHDLSFVENPKWFSRSYYLLYSMLTRLAVKTSRHILTVSEFSKREILRYCRSLKSEDVSVVYNATSLSAETVNWRSEAEKYILFVGSFDPRKNLPTLISAVENISGVKLKVVGGHHRSFNSGLIPNGGTSNVEFLGNITDKELSELYANAEALVFPSLYEGFGIPPIEAMSFGCPVLVSDIPVMHEVCSDAVIYFNPKDKESLASAIISVLQMSKEDRQTLISKGFDNCSRFSWSKSAKIIIFVLNRICQ